jgi:hypothetical protein
MSEDLTDDDFAAQANARGSPSLSWGRQAKRKDLQHV